MIKRSLFAIIILAIFGGFFISHSIESVSDLNTISVRPERAPDFTLPKVNGGKVKLSNYKGKIILIDFWATWCPPCRKGIPDLIELQKKFKKDLVVIGISVDRDTKKDVSPFIKKMKINYPVAYYNDEVIQSYGGIESIPTTFIIDRQGTIAQKYVGLVDKQILENLISTLK